MVEQASNRDTIKQELLTEAEGYLATFDTQTTVFEDPANNYVAKQEIGADGCGITMVTYKAEGLTEEMWSRWEQDPLGIGA